MRGDGKKRPLNQSRLCVRAMYEKQKSESCIYICIFQEFLFEKDSVVNMIIALTINISDS